jgi:carbon storage regulator
MLVLSRKAGEVIHIGGGIVVTVVSVREGRVRVGIDAPKDVPVLRGELVPPPAGDAPGAKS